MLYTLFSRILHNGLYVTNINILQIRTLYIFLIATKYIENIETSLRIMWICLSCWRDVTWLTVRGAGGGSRKRCGAGRRNAATSAVGQQRRCDVAVTSTPREDPDVTAVENKERGRQREHAHGGWNARYPTSSGIHNPLNEVCTCRQQLQLIQCRENKIINDFFLTVST